ncbi:PqqD family peptide modification chaperone [Thalassorhabdomicrobium marinisediminis]|uniref:PqqD family peptide modification chaperone n=1 Tax=Thalassorhabdomicrobium marinisediminis TaxID=2170577 RepID=UPI0024922F77|nr:PqqD family protein [Thalassorhabdomicrobium marinisediminis]
MVTETTFVQFDGLDHPVALNGASDLLPLIADIATACPHRHSRSARAAPFATLAPADGGDWTLTPADAPQAPRRWDGVNAVCDLVAEMAWERIRSHPDMLCLHAGGVAFGGRLVAFPNGRRAGKSTLTAALAHLGHEVFTDDVLPVRKDIDSGTFHGIANGVAPRVRLPLPDSFDAALSQWVAQDFGPSNRQYKYLTTAPIAQAGATMPLGAIVLLDRQETPCAPRLDPVSEDEALATLITQNFARTLHASIILSSAEVLARHLPVYRLTYACGQQAAAYLSAHEALQDLPVARHDATAPEVRQAPLEERTRPAPAFDPAASYVRRDGVTETRAGEAWFLADSSGIAIYHLNGSSAAIWRLLAEPITLAEVCEVLCAAYPQVDPAAIRTDSEALLQNLAAARLIETAPAQEPVA